MVEDNRRPLSVRSNSIVQKIAIYLARRDFPSPNQISILSIVFALIGAVLYGSVVTKTGVEWKLLLAAVCVQLRLLCNLFDGMVAVEGGKSSPVGGLYNEVPDRVADTLFFLGFAYAIDAFVWGLVLSLFAMATAYIRTLGGSLGLPQSFIGPMAKQHRMALLTGASILAAGEWWLSQTFYVMYVSLGLLIIGSATTCITRLLAIAKALNQLHGK